MSIINEALQKAGGIKEAGVESIVKDAEKPGIESLAKNKKTPHYRWIYIAGISVLVIAAALALFTKKTGTVKENPPVPKIIPDAQPPLAKQSPHINAVINSVADNAAPVPQSSLPDASEFKLTGIVLGEGAPMAIINESVYMKGDTIKDLKISKIASDTVSLEKDGRTLELRVK